MFALSVRWDLRVRAEAWRMAEVWREAARAELVDVETLLEEDGAPSAESLLEI